jgi:hypothetical protein
VWTILKFDKKKLESLKKDFSKKLGKDFIIYHPKSLIQNYKNNMLVDREINLLGDYLFCFHKKFQDQKTLGSLKFSRGLKYFLEGFLQSQEEIQFFIEKCKKYENRNGYLSNEFFEMDVDSEYKFSSGPFSNMIFKIIQSQKNKINILMGNIKTTINKKEFFFRPI